MALLEQLAQQREELAARWFDRMAETYPPDTARLLRQQRDRFRNPVGWTLRVETAALLDQLLAGVDRERCRPHLEALLRVRAVQEFTPSQSAALIFLVKNVVREAVGAAKGAAEAGELLAFESRVDALALLAFDVYMECRERIFAISAQEMRRRSAILWERAQGVYDALNAADPLAEPDPLLSAARPAAAPADAPPAAGGAAGPDKGGQA